MFIIRLANKDRIIYLIFLLEVAHVERKTIKM